MSLLEDLAANTKDMLVIPCCGKMFYSNVNEKEQVLAVVINKGYLETDSLVDMLSYIDSSDTENIVFVGGIDKVRFNDGTIVYRQRVFIHNILEVLKFTASIGFKLHVPTDFRIPINSVMNNLTDCPYLERIARKYTQSIDAYLKKVVLLQLYYMAEVVGISHDLGAYYRKCKARLHLKGILDYAPVLCSGYSISKGTSSLFMDESVLGKDIFHTTLTDYGYRKSVITSLFKKGGLDES